MEEHTPSKLPILMYHSISNGVEPTCIPPETFEMQMELISECGWTVISSLDIRRWLTDESPLPAKALAITFDDGFTDFYDVAYPILQRLNYPSTVFMPTALAGQTENWAYGNTPGRPLLSWQAIRDLDGPLVQFASHSRTHADLTSLDSKELQDEVAGAKVDLENQLNRPVPDFAAPYGRVNAAVLSEIQQSYEMAYGVKLALTNAQSPLYDLPRLEMFYYQNEKVWRNFLRERGGLYLALRQTLRSVKASMNSLSSTQ